ncbi:MAG TPA: hypothetical protein PK228_21420, partial [Saprospiraceae bacterium]|nr:hypothetical protein [Saprospiraceae bacterium]
MKNKNTLLWCLSVLGIVLTANVSFAQNFPGNILNTVGTTTFPSTGTGGCTVAPQNTGGTLFECNVAGIGANVKPLSIQINMTHTFDGDITFFLESPGGSTTPLTVLAPQRLELSSANGGGGDNFTNTVFCDQAALSITAGAPPYTGTFRPEGSLAASCDPDGTGPLGAYVANITTISGFTGGQNGSWKLRIFDAVGGDIGNMIAWSITFGDPACSLAGVTLNPLTIPSTNPAVCGATNVTLTAPVLACTSPIAVYVDGVFLANVLPGASYVIPALSSGLHTVRYELSACDNKTQSINIIDGVPPTITCPGNITINLDPGACDVIYSYTVGVTDNCPFLVPATPAQFPLSFANHGSGLAFSLQGNTLPGGVYFNLTNNAATPLKVTGFGVRFGNPLYGVVNAPQTLQVYTAPTFVGNQTNAAAWTNIGPCVVNPIPPYF